MMTSKKVIYGGMTHGQTKPQDAAQAKDSELGAFFRAVQEEDERGQDRAMQLLKKRLVRRREIRSSAE